MSGSSGKVQLKLTLFEGRAREGCRLRQFTGDMLKRGIKGTLEFAVTEEKLAVNVGSGSVRVFATPSMIAGIEKCASQSVENYLDSGKTTVGTEINVTHEAATPLGMTVRFETELIEISQSGRQLLFSVSAYDQTGVIGRGTHKRVVVTEESFQRRADEKIIK